MLGASEEGGRGLARAIAQSTLLDPQPNRLEVLNCEPTWELREVSVHFHRNLAAEHILPVLEPFAAYAGFKLDASFSAYDDSLAFADEPDKEPDVSIIWLDHSRLPDLTAEELAAFLSSRASTLRSKTTGPILVLDVPLRDDRSVRANALLRERFADLPAVRLCPLSEVEGGFGTDFWSERALTLTGVPISSRGLMSVGRHLGCQWLPAVLKPRIRALAVDLDNTLYHGVLGEEGPAGLVVDADYKQVQEKVVDLRRQGLFVSVISRNEMSDVRALFEQREDFPLRPEHVDAWAVSWGKKSDGIREAAQQLRVAPETFLFVDDNPGELLEVQTSIPGIEIGHASSPVMSLQVLTFHPGLFSFGDAGADAFRTADLASEDARAQLRMTSSEEDYLAALQVELVFALDRPTDRARLAELSSKTNQFSTALARLDEMDIDARMKDPMARVVSIDMSDRLSSSGIIGFVAAMRNQAGEVTIEDVCVSCRALGRGVEELMLAEALAVVANELGAKHLTVPFTEGPRNGPALHWLSRTAESMTGGRATVAPHSPSGISTLTIRWEG